MDIYKKAAFLKLRFQTSRGPLTVEHLPDLKMTELAKLCKEQLEVVKKSKGSDDEELAFLQGTDDGKENLEVLRFEILKDVYLEKQHQKTQEASDVKRKQEIEKLNEYIAKKQDAELESMSLEDLMKKRDALMKEQ